MPERETLERAREDAREGKSPSTQAGEFVREEIHHVREGKHGVRSPQQAIAIGLSKARRAGVKLAPPKGSASTRKKSAQDTKAGSSQAHKPSVKRSRAVSGALRHEVAPGSQYAGTVPADEEICDCERKAEPAAERAESRPHSPRRVIFMNIGANRSSCAASSY